LLSAQNAFRFWRHRPVATGWILGTLATGIAAAVLLTSLCIRVLSPRLPMRDADRIMRVEPQRTTGWGPLFYVGAGLDEYAPWRACQHVFPAYTTIVFDYDDFVRVAGEMRSVVVMRASKGLFRVTGTQPEYGRWFAFPADLQAGVALMTDEAARRLFGSASEAVGRTMDLSSGRDDVRTPVTVVGVLPPAFNVGAFEPVQYDTVRVPDLILPMPDGELPALEDTRANPARWLLARLPANVSPATVATQLREQCGARFAVTPLRQVLFGRNDDVARIILWGALGLALLSLVNAFGTVVAIEIERRGEIATRRALGATRRQLSWLWLLEGAVITAGAAGVGLVVADLATHLIARAPALAALELSRMTVGWREILVAVGLAGAFWLGRSAICRGIHGGQRPSVGDSARTVSPRTRVYRAALVGFQVGAAFALLLATEVAATSAAKLLGTNLGFDPHAVLTVRVGVPRSANDHDRYRAYRAAILTAIRDAPGPRVVGVATNLPFSHWQETHMMPVHPGATVRHQVGYVAVTPEYFVALGAHVVAGHLLRPDDPPEAVVVNEPFATTYLGDPQQALGQIVNYGAGFVPGRIVGVVHTMQQAAIGTAPKPVVYASMASNNATPFLVQLVTRERGNLGAAERALTSAIQRVAPDQFVEVTPLIDRFWQQTSTTNATAAVVAGFTLFALILMAGGLNGVLAQLGVSRAKEFATRQALGATPGQVTTLMLRAVLLPVSLGVAGGAVAIFWATRALEHALPNVSNVSFSVWAAAVGLVALVSIAASWRPARRAGRVDIVSQLRAL
jgi:predicted permease